MDVKTHDDVERTLAYIVREKIHTKSDRYGTMSTSIEEKIDRSVEMLGRMCDFLADKGIMSMNDFEEVIGTGQHGIVEWGHAR